MLIFLNSDIFNSNIFIKYNQENKKQSAAEVMINMTVQDRIVRCKILMLMSEYPEFAKEIGLSDESHFVNNRSKDVSIHKEPDR